MRVALIIGLVLLLAVPAAYAGFTCTYDWEDCGTVLSLFGTGDPPMIVTNVTSPVHGGLRALKLEDNSPSGTPQAYVAWVTGLVDGDSVWAEFWRYDTTPAASPSGRIWAHWNDDPMDVNGYAGSAGGNDDYGPGTGWDATSWGWMVAGHTGIVIECRTYSNPGDIVWIDDITVKYIGNGAPCIHFPIAGPSAAEPSTWGGIKALYQ